MRASTLLVAIASVASAHEFTRMSFAQGLLRRDSTGYEPEVTSCGTGTTCAEACGAGYELCSSTDNKSHCYNPTAGETCCSYTGTGSSCESGYFCAHNSVNTTDSSAVCCAEGVDLETCATENGLDSTALASDPTATTTITSTSATSTTSITIPLTTAVYSVNSTSISPYTAPLTTAPLVTVASLATAASASPIYSANNTGLYTASAAILSTGATKAPTTVKASGTGAATSATAAVGSSTDVATSSGNTVAPVAALTLVAGVFAAFL